MSAGIPRNITVLGSTGSVGQQALEVIGQNRGHFRLKSLTAFNNVKLLAEQALEFNPESVVICNEDLYPYLKEALSSRQTKVYTGEEAISQVITSPGTDTVLNAIVGIAGLNPLVTALNNNKEVILANKEAMAVAGGIIMAEPAVAEKRIIPADSEHSAVFQCLQGEESAVIEKIYLTASGGPFRELKHKELEKIAREEALRHPTWDMGNKVTIDSATMMNKGLEVMAARWLFRLDPGKLEVLIHPQSVVHALVQFTDGSIKAQMAYPDMKHYLHYALYHPDRKASGTRRLSFEEYPGLSFEKAGPGRFRCLDMAYMAMNTGGNIPSVLNAANEVAVEAFLNERINFVDIPEVIERTIEKTGFSEVRGTGEILYYDTEARRYSEEIVKTIELTRR